MEQKIPWRVRSNSLATECVYNQNDFPLSFTLGLSFLLYKLCVFYGLLGLHYMTCNFSG